MSPAVNGVSWQSGPEAIDRLVTYGLDTFGTSAIALVTACLLIETSAWYAKADPTGIAGRVERHLRWLDTLELSMK